MLSDDYSPYCGLTYNKHNRVAAGRVRAPHRGQRTDTHRQDPAHSCPGRDRASRPVVGVSSKPDLAELVITNRFMGVTGVIDLRPEQTHVWPADVRRMVTDPTAAITDAHEALTVAETMLATSGVGFSGASGGRRRRRRPVGDPAPPRRWRACSMPPARWATTRECPGCSRRCRTSVVDHKDDEHHPAKSASPRG